MRVLHKSGLDHGANIMSMFYTNYTNGDWWSFKWIISFDINWNNIPLSLGVLNILENYSLEEAYLLDYTNDIV